MDQAWIAISVFAALMQAVRTAAQKTLNKHMSTLGTTYVRSVFGLPVSVLWLAGVVWFEGSGVPVMSGRFLLMTFLGAAVQVLATMLLIEMFRLKNFAVGTMLTKVDIVMTAFIGALLFSEVLSLGGLAALAVVTVGVMLMTAGRLGLGAFTKAGLAETLLGRPTQIALACAFLFTLSYLFLREATLAIQPGTGLWRGAWTVVIATAMQVAFVGVWLAWREPGEMGKMWPNRRIATFIGVTSALGSIGWFTAFALQNASYVRAVGQIEAVFTVLISWLYFKERLTPLELAGVVVTVAGVLAFRLAY